MAGWEAPSEFTNEIRTFCPIAPCGHTTLWYLHPTSATSNPSGG
jgi:hypothetical protein